MQIISVRDGAKLRVGVAGAGRPVVLISGLGGTAGFWQPVAEALAPEFQTVCFDQRGIGQSERGTIPVTVRGLAEDTWQIIDALGINQPVLWGHSTGGAIVQEMTLMRPADGSRLVLSGSWAGPDWFLERMFGLRLDVLQASPARYVELAALMGSTPRWLRSHPETLQAALNQTPTSSGVVIIQERIRALLDHDCRKRLGDVQAPALVLGAEDDMIVPPYLQEELASLLTGSTLHILDQGGHFFPVSRTAETVQLFQRWLAR